MRQKSETAVDAALDLATAGVPVFPCRADKRPAVQHGFKAASRDPAEIRAMFAGAGAELIGVPTGLVSGFDVLDIDAKHRAARDWWNAHRERLLPTRALRTRSGGLHLWFQHAPGLRNSAGRIAPGVDVRGEGGYAIAWHATGLPVLCDAEPAPWPEWLNVELEPPPAPSLPHFAPPGNVDGARRYALAALRSAVGRVAGASEGARNNELNTETFAMMRFVWEGALAAGEVADALAIAARHAGLSLSETAATIASAMRAGGVA